MKEHNKDKLKTVFKYFLCFILVISLYSCSGGEYEDSPRGFTTALPDTSAENPYYNPAESDILSLNMSVSTDYSLEDNIVSCYINVYYQNGDFVNTLNEDNFEVIINGITLSTSFRTFDLTTSNINLVGLILDSSGSMSGARMADTKEAAKMFIDTMTINDQTALIDFDSEARVAQQLTTDKDALKTAIDALVAEGGTNIGGGIIECVEAVGSRPGKTAGILLTDGEDGGGLIDDGIDKALQIDIPIYTIFLGEDITDSARLDLERIATDTGGQFYEVMYADELQTLFATTIPQVLAARPARDSYIMTFANQYPAQSYVDVLITVRYFNSWGSHTTDFAASYYVEPQNEDE